MQSTKSHRHHMQHGAACNQCMSTRVRAVPPCRAETSLLLTQGTPPGVTWLTQRAACVMPSDQQDDPHDLYLGTR